MAVGATRDRIEWLAAHVEEVSGLPDFMRARLRTVLELSDSVLNGAEEIWDDLASQLGLSLEGYLSSLPGILDTGDESQLVEWAQSMLGTTRRTLEGYLSLANQTDELTAQMRTALVAMIDAVRIEEARMGVLQEELGYRARSEDLAKEAEATVTLIQQAAGMAGDASLARHFAEYSRREWWSANIFRVLTIVAIGGALWAAAASGHPHEGDWVALSYRIAQLAGIAALATYLGRQAAQHRRVYNWARSMQVQLQSFPAFIEPIADGDTRSSIYNEFARRVLGPPPEKGPSNDDAYPNQQAIELLTVLARKSQ